VSFDEYSQQPANIFSEIISKALADHMGYAIFAGTIKGKDQLFKTYHDTKDNPEWFTLWQNVDVSLETESGATIEALRTSMEHERALVAIGQMSQAEYDQEWFLSADAAIHGAFYLHELDAALKEKRIGIVPHDPVLPVDTDWDLGMDDAMAIWFSQTDRGGQVRIIDYYENSGEGFPHYVSVLHKRREERKYTYGKHFPPHDIAVRELGTGKSRKDEARALGLIFQDPAPKLPLVDGINAVRSFLPRCWFNEATTARGLDCLRHYRKRYNRALQQFTGEPVHDFASHAADAFRTLAVRWTAAQTKRVESGRGHIPNVVGDHGWMGN
jgi:phage terminase large subunit